MSWSVQGKRNVIGVIWMVGGMALLVAAMMRNAIFLTALVVLAAALFVATQLLTCPRCGARVYSRSGEGLLHKLPDACPRCGLKTTDRP
jgi:ribosomal protein S27AE